jgi:hypothetical protein
LAKEKVIPVKVIETANLGLAAARGCGRIAFDALSADSLPYKADEVVRPDVLEGLLNDWSWSRQESPVCPTACSSSCPWNPW